MQCKSRSEAVEHQLLVDQQQLSVMQVAPSNGCLANGVDSCQKQLQQLPKKKKISESDSGGGYRLYSDRWWILACVVLVYGGNYCHWIAYPSVGKVAAKYYNQTGERIDLILTLSTGVGIPLALFATYVVDAQGIKVGIHSAAVLTAIGEILCLLSSIPWVDPDYMSSDAKYYLAVIGQALTGAAAPFVTCLPTKISQHWFGNNFQRTLATTGITLSAASGLILGHSVTPLFVVEPEDVPMMNLVWFVPAFFGSVMALVKIRHSLPPTPPSRSAELQILKKHRNRKHGTFRTWVSETKQVLSNPMAVILIYFVSAGTSHAAILSTKLEQLMCSRGYSDILSGLAASTVLITGLVCAAPIGYFLHKTGKNSVMSMKAISFIFIVSCVLQGYYLRLPDNTAGIFVSMAVFGMIAFGSVATAQEMLGECTYPVDQTIGLAWISMFGFVQGTLLMLLENVMGSPLTPEEMEVQVCVEQGDEGHQQPKDHSVYIYFVCSYLALATLVFALFFKTKLNRTLVDEGADIAGDSGCPAAQELDELKKEMLLENGDAPSSAAAAAAPCQKQPPTAAADAAEPSSMTDPLNAKV